MSQGQSSGIREGIDFIHRECTCISKAMSILGIIYEAYMEYYVHLNQFQVKNLYFNNA